MANQESLSLRIVEVANLVDVWDGDSRSWELGSADEDELNLRSYDIQREQRVMGRLSMSRFFSWHAMYRHNAIAACTRHNFHPRQQQTTPRELGRRRSEWRVIIDALAMCASSPIASQGCCRFDWSEIRLGSKCHDDIWYSSRTCQNYSSKFK
ncbi:hypothetical protein BCR44DRAFT_408526 [Catenaria anguillulae PL171]|uniref:Uncharacterized protein n=1 Tax=Catenaria anguillulae PL171 TaxID=765915 RepID=A0A1Y2I579_9FUNG|nr:hypothetical protein BCR44DRAFT_408526 [Catenaria anguillulae PL171]